MDGDSTVQRPSTTTSWVGHPLGKNKFWWHRIQRQEKFYLPKDCFEYHDGTGLKIRGRWLQWWAGFNFGLINYSSNFLSVSGSRQNVNCGFLFKQSDILYNTFFFTWHVRKIIRVNDFAGTSEILLAHLKFCWRSFWDKSCASKRPTPAKFCWRAPENTVTLYHPLFLGCQPPYSGPHKPGGTVCYPVQPGLTWRNRRLPSPTRINLEEP